MRSEQRIQIAEVRTEIANLDTRLYTQIAGIRQAHPLDGRDRARDGGTDGRNPAVPRRVSGMTLNGLKSRAASDAGENDLNARS